MTIWIDTFTQIHAKLHYIVWGPVLLSLLIGTGFLLSVRMKFLQLRRFGFVMKRTIGSLFSTRQHHIDSSGVSPFQACATALSSTIGVGSIAGVATALVSGGPGAIFWMWISAIFGMITKYAEIVLSLQFREKNDKGQWVGGPMYYIQNGLNMKWLATLFAFFAAIACFGIGNATQSNAIAVALDTMLHIPPSITGVLLSILIGAVILGGIRRIATVNEVLAPFMALLYLLCALAALFCNRAKIPDALALIITEAFHIHAVSGGAAGYGILTAMRFGFARGVFSNEAGLGSAPIAHAASSCKNPVEQGFWGMFEAFFATIIVCTLTALVILTTDVLHTTNLQGAALSIAAYNAVLPNLGGIGVMFSMILFATSSILGWAYYGEKSVEYLFRKKLKAVTHYRILYVAVVFIGAVGNLDTIWSISDTMNGLMALPNLIGIIGLSGVVVRLTHDYFTKISK